jgi:cytochrome b
MTILNQKQSVLVWDMPIRIFHWLLAASFAGAWITSESESQQMIHYAFGYTAVALVLFRVVWGVVGTRYARFGQFMKGPAETMHHIKALLTGNQHVGLGHNPAGALAMISLMILILLIGLTGYWSVKEFLGDFMSEAHEVIANLTLAVVVIHIAAAIIMSFMQKENLIRSMVTGKKHGTSEQAIRYPMNFVGMGLLLIYVFCFYLIVSGALPSLTQ